MRQALGLPAPEERIGDAAHDFASLLGAGGSISRAPPRSTACRPCPRAGCCDCRRCCGARASRRCDRSRPWLAWARARNAMPAAVTPVRAPEPRPAVGAAAAQAQRDDHRDLDRQPLRHLRRAHPASWRRCPSWAAAGRGAARPDRARGARPLCAALPAASCRRRRGASSGDRPGRCWRGSPASRASPRSGRRASRASPSGSPTPSRPPRGVRQIAGRGGGRHGAAGAGGALHAHGARRPHRHGRRRPRHHRLQDRRNLKQLAAAPSRARRRSCRWRRPSPRPAGSRHCRRARRVAALHLGLGWRAAGRRSSPSTSTISRLHARRTRRPACG